MARQHTINAYEIQLPDGWEDRSVHCLLGPEDGGVQHVLQIVIDRELATRDVHEYARDRLEQVVAVMPNAEMVKEGDRTLAGGTPAYEAIYKWISGDDQVTFQKLVYTIVDGIGYAFNASFSKKTLKTLGADVDAMIASFRPRA